MAEAKRQIMSLLGEAVEHGSPEERAAFLDKACAGDAGQRARLEELLRAHQAAGNFLQGDRPPAQPAATLDEPIREGPGAAVGPYKLLEQIGEGGFGVVFMAEQTQPVRRKVALKVLKPGMDTRQVVARFEAERQALALMDHPNIAHVFDGGETASGRPYFVMELVRGVPITAFCDRNHLMVRERLELFVQVCQAVQHAHQKGVIHRDLKPSNVLVTLHDDKAVVKVIDFGIAKAAGQRLTEKTLFTNFAQMIGTPLYMSPEQAQLSGLDVDTRSDVYSLGVLLYELLTGKTPFDQERFKEVGFDEMRRIIREEEPPRPSTRISTLGQAAATVSTDRRSDPKQLSRLCRGELDWIVMKCLEKDRNRRYESASAFAADVQRYLNDEPVQACPPSAGYRLGKFVRRNKRSLAMAACIFLALAAISGAIGWAVRDKGAREEGLERDRRAREEALDQAVETTLNETGLLMDEGKWAEALAAVERAEKLLAAAGRTGRPLRLLTLRNELSMAQRLEDIYFGLKREATSSLILSGAKGTKLVSESRPDSSEEEFFWGREQDARFAREFREFGIAVEVLTPPEASARIAHTSIRAALVQALDEWAAMRKRGRGDQDEFWKKLVEIARRADADGWRNQFRQALLRRDRPALEKLAAAVPIDTVPPATAYLLGHALRDLGAVDRAVAVLRQAHRHHPEDFWLNDALGWFNQDAFRPPRYDEALRYYSMAVAVRPRNVAPHQAVARLLAAQGALEEAIAEYSKALELDRRNRGLLMERARAYHNFHQYEKALADFSKVIELDPKSALAWTSRGSTYNALKQWDKAIADHSKAIDLDPKLAWAWRERGWTYNALKQWDKAIADFSEAIELDPKLAVAWVDRGNSFNGLGEFDKAIADCSKAIELEPKNAVAWYNRAFSFDRLRQWDKAIADSSKAIELDSKLAWAWYYRGWCYSELKQWDKAIADYSKAIELEPKNAELWHQRGHSFNGLGEFDKAIADSSKAIELDPKHWGAWQIRGITYAELGQWQKAARDLATATELQKDAGYSWSLRALVCLKLGDPKGYREVCNAMLDACGGAEQPDADRELLPWTCVLAPECGVEPARVVELAEQLATRNPQKWSVQMTLGAALYRAGRFEEATRQLNKTANLTAEPVYALETPWFFLAMAHERQGHTDVARRWLDKAIESLDRPKGEAARPLWNRRLTLELLRREAEALLNREKSESKPGK
jgi:tetratricopeptide (TPR) repeat protein